MTKSYTCIIVEDEPLAMKRTLAFAQRLENLEVLACFDNSINALNFLNESQVDIALLDIQMDEISGIELIESAPSGPQYILTTAFDEYALKGYDLNVVDYLLKPYSYPRFTQAIQKAIARIPDQAESYSEGIFIKSENKLIHVPFQDILFIEGMRDYRRFHLIDKRIMTLETFSELEKRLPKNLVCRVHKSYMVGISAIEKIERKRIYIGEYRIPISDTYYREFSGMIQ